MIYPRQKSEDSTSKKQHFEDPGELPFLIDDIPFDFSLFLQSQPAIDP